MGSSDLDSNDFVLADTNLFVAVGGPGNSKFRKLRKFAARHQIPLQVPQRVVGELSTMHVADRVGTALEEGWAAKVNPPPTTDFDAVQAVAIDDGNGYVEPSLETALSGEDTPLSRPLFTYPAKEALAETRVAEFARYWMESSTSREIVADEVGYVPLGED